MSKLIVGNWDDPSELREVSDKEALMYDRAWVYPVSVKEELLVVLTERARLKKIYSDSMSLIFQFNNKLIRENRRD